MTTKKPTTRKPKTSFEVLVETQQAIADEKARIAVDAVKELAKATAAIGRITRERDHGNVVGFSCSDEFLDVVEEIAGLYPCYRGDAVNLSGSIRMALETARSYALEVTDAQKERDALILDNMALRLAIAGAHQTLSQAISAEVTDDVTVPQPTDDKAL